MDMSVIRYNNSTVQLVDGMSRPLSVEPATPKSCCKTSCVSVTGGETGSCVNTPAAITALGTGVVGKIPVVLAELTAQFNLDSVIELPEYAYEIKFVKKKVKITQCLLLQNTNMLFIKGFIRKNIDYSTRVCSNAQGICGDIRHCTVDVPFTCTTPVTFNGTPPLAPVASTTTEFEYFREENISGPDFSEKDKLLSGDMREYNQISTEFFNELPYCELVSSRIVEFDEQLHPVQDYCAVTPFEEKKFKRIEEKAVLFLTLKLLQNRQVAIPPAAAAGLVCEKDKDDDED